AARCRALQIPAFLTKPVNATDLLDAIGRVRPPPAPARGATLMAPPLTAAPTAPVRRVKVLLAEDNVVNQLVAVKLLTRRGHTVTVAKNGRDALAALARDTFDLVLMDVQMPEMSGLDATAAIRLREQGTAAALPAARALLEAARTLERLGAESRLEPAEAAWRRLSVEAAAVMDAIRFFDGVKQEVAL